MKVVIDFETRSACDLKKHGSYVYSEDPTTEILCMAYMLQGAQPFIWKRGDNPDQMLRLIAAADTIEAHNLFFEYGIWKNICEKRMGWPALPEEKLRCCMAKASQCALPRSLDGACSALGLEQQKDRKGHQIMMKLCRPRKPKKDEPPGLYWNEDPADLELLYKYCLQDVIAEEALSNALPDLPEKEQRIFALDRVINSRGIQADIASAHRMIEMVAEHEGKLLKRLGELTFGAVRTAKQTEVMRNHLRGLGCDLPDLTAKTVMEALNGDWSDEVREILEIRRSLGRSSAAKYQAIIDRASNDGRVRGSFLYHGAATGRVAGAGIQPQNLPSRIKLSDDPERMLSVVNTGGLEFLTALYDDDPMSVAGAVVRSILTASEGKELIVGDLSAIEGRMLAWLAGEETELEVYRSGKDPYVASAAMILHKRYEDITPEERNKIGKVATLSAGYMGSAGAARKFGGDAPYRELWSAHGLTGEKLEEKIDESIVNDIIRPWRQAHPKTVAFWYDIERACMAAVKEPGKIFTARSISYRVQDRFLKCRLPSGRLLYYYDPEIMDVETSWGEMKEAVTYLAVDGMTKKWVRTNTYGGKSVENVTQAAARDIMVEGMLRIEAAGYPVIMTIHDEVASEVPRGFGSVEEFERLMCVTPTWAPGLPLNAHGFRSKRYKK